MKAKTILVEILIVLVLCSLALAEWTEPLPVTEVNTEYEEMPPFLSFDGLSLYFSRVRTDTFYYARLFEARRQEPYGPFTSVSEVLSSGYQHVFSPWVSPDNLRMYYFAQKESPALWQLKVSERASVNDPWPAGSDISELNQLGKLCAPKLTADELIIFFGSYDIPGGLGGYDLWMAARSDRYSQFGPVRNLAELNTAANDGGPYVTPDGLTLYFHSDRNGSYQIFRATRKSLTELFGNIEHLSLFDTPQGLSCHPSMSSDGCALYFVKQLGDNGSMRDIYVSYWIVDPYDAAVTAIEDAIAEKLDALDKVNAALEEEWTAYEALQELLESGDYGDLKKGDIVTAMQKIHSAIQHQELSKKALDRSIEKLEDALAALGWEPPPSVSHWKFDEGSGTTVYDSVGNNHGTVYGATWTTDQIDSALSFDGVNDYVDVEDDITLEPQNLTVSAWVYRESTSSQHVILQKGSTHFHDDRNGYLFKILESSNSYPNRAILHVTINNRCNTSPTSNTEIQAGIWYHIAATYDGSYARIYVNGVEDGTDISDTGPVDYSGGYQDLKIGAQEEGHGLLCGHFGGSIDEVAIYDLALSSYEIQRLYHNSLAGL